LTVLNCQGALALIGCGGVFFGWARRASICSAVAAMVLPSQVRLVPRSGVSVEAPVEFGHGVGEGEEVVAGGQLSPWGRGEQADQRDTFGIAGGE